VEPGLPVAIMVKSHYVPQFYLRNFSIRGKPGRVYVYRRDNKGAVDIDVGKIAAVKGFYTAKSITTGGDSDIVEKMFAELEGPASAVFRRLVSDPSGLPVSNDESEMVSVFIAFLHVRGRSFRQKDINFRIALMEKKIAEKAANDIGGFRADMEKAGVPFDNEEQFEEMRKQFADGITRHYKFEYGRKEQGYILKEMFESAEMLAPTILYKRWKILECLHEVFVTSDNPLTLMQPIDMPFQEVEGFLNLKIVLPIAPSRCLVLDNGTVSRAIEVVAVDRQRVLNINRSTMFNAHREIYSNRNSQRIKKALSRTIEGESEKVYINGYDPTKVRP
jgi:Protein of unknown function (DUF4238)